ncbi:hypothetical protein [Photobacterium galatheae]|uniref:Uncharacterized protein n=1 Tax=Photobacterium galatheae TaxID=1654360 RepID=A0A066RY34_9GAMM|nr:hypothetical protein [Photobacterium galatheae]KDM92288.1 hypothetical protein EA58_07295 [Photobacterium galatheae]MCM0150531.1 hypothetical protein [Photobacterium galatheae]
MRVFYFLLCSFPLISHASLDDFLQRQNAFTEIASSRCNTEWVEGQDYTVNVNADGSVKLNLIGRKGAGLAGGIIFTKKEWEGQQRVIIEDQLEENKGRRDCIGRETEKLDKAWIDSNKSSSVNPLKKTQDYINSINMALYRSQVQVTVFVVTNHRTGDKRVVNLSAFNRYTGLIKNVFSKFSSGIHTNEFDSQYIYDRHCADIASYYEALNIVYSTNNHRININTNERQIADICFNKGVFPYPMPLSEIIQENLYSASF